MSGRLRVWVGCLAAVVLVALSGWGLAETAAARPADPAGAVGTLSDASRDAASLHNRRVVAEPAAAKRVEIERLVPAVVVAAAVALAALGGGLATSERTVRGRRGVSWLRSRGPPLSFVS